MSARYADKLIKRAQQPGKNANKTKPIKPVTDPHRGPGMTPEQLYAESRHAALFEKKSTGLTIGKHKNPALIAGLAAAVTSLVRNKPDEKLKTIVNPQPATVDASRGAGAHDVANFPHPVSVLSAGVPVAIRSDMKATEVMAVADKKVVKRDGVTGVAVTMRCRMPVANYNGNANKTDVSTQQYDFNPADSTSFPLIAPAAKIFDCWNCNHARLYARTEQSTSISASGGGSTTCRVVMSVDPEVTDAPPITKLAAESQTVVRAFAGWENQELEIPQLYFKRTRYYYMDDGIAADGDARVTTPCKWYMTVADNDSGTSAVMGEVWVEAEFEFWSSTLSNLTDVPPPFKAQIGSVTTNLAALLGLYSNLDTSLHACVPGAGSTIVGSNVGVSILPSNSPSTTTTAKFRVMLPFRGTPTTGGQNTPGSYQITTYIDGTFSAGTVMQIGFASGQAQTVLHAGPNQNGANPSGAFTPSYATGAASSMLGFCATARYDVSASPTPFSYSSGSDSFTGGIAHWTNGPGVLCSITTTSAANSITAIHVFVNPVAATQPALLGRTFLNDGKTVVSTTNSTIDAFDGRTKHVTVSSAAASVNDDRVVRTAPIVVEPVGVQPPRLNIGDEKYVVVQSPSPTPSISEAAAHIKSYFVGSHLGSLPQSAFTATAKAMLGK